MATKMATLKFAKHQPAAKHYLSDNTMLATIFVYTLMCNRFIQILNETEQFHARTIAISTASAAKRPLVNHILVIIPKTS